MARGLSASAVSSVWLVGISGADESKPFCRSKVSKHEERNAKEKMSVAHVIPKPPLLRGRANSRMWY